MSHSFFIDGIPILETQFNLTLQEMREWTDEEQCTLLCTLDGHLDRVEHDTREALAKVIGEIRGRHGMPR
jgi:hypothetical protein